jgi:hypothetical protein
MVSTFEKVVGIAVASGRAEQDNCLPQAAIHQDLGINGNEADEFVAALCNEFGNWVAEWPWARFVDFNEPPAWLGPKVWKALRLPNAATAFPGYVEERLELGHVAAVIENGGWFDP